MNINTNIMDMTTSDFDKYEVLDMTEELERENELEVESESFENELKDKSKKTSFFEVYLDTEYLPKNKEFDSNTGHLISHNYLSIQLYFKGKIDNTSLDFKVLIINDFYKDKLNHSELEQFISDEDLFVYFADLNSETDYFVTQFFLITLMQEYNYNFSAHPPAFVKNFIFNLYFFYSLKDLTIGFGEANMLPYYLGKKKHIARKRNYTGKMFFVEDLSGTIPRNNFDIKLNDLFGIDVGSLETIMSSCGLDTSNKNLLDDFKERMDLALINHTYLYCIYAMQDASVLFTILEIKIDEPAYNKIIRDIYKYKISEPKENKIPGRLGLGPSSKGFFRIENLVSFSIDLIVD
uniref:Putative encoded protein n=1 Tax=Dunaliella salina TaxID=3046 RepID=A0A1C8XRM4_DUNSA|nr:putative encoded protein [Dunaliella salina]AOH77125.1 putative encoded protein [Dunaliella salina]